MARSGITVEGLGEMAAALQRAADLARRAAQEAVTEEVKTVREDAREGAAHDTGQLEDGIVGRLMELDGEVRSTARHSEHVEHGTYKDEAQPFMAPAAERSRRRFPARTAALVRSRLEGIR